MMKSVSPIRLVILKWANLFLCILGFAWLCKGQWSNFILASKGVSVSWETQNDFVLPNIIFCRDHPFKNGSRLQANLTSLEVFESELLDVPMSSDITSPANPNLSVDHQVDILYTQLNGICRMFSFSSSLKPLTYLYFPILENESLNIHFATPENDIRLIWHEWGSPPISSVDASSDAEIDLNLKIVEKLSTNENPCSLDTTWNDYYTCVFQSLSKDPEFESIPCVPIHILRYFKTFGKRACLQDESHFFDKAKDKLVSSIRNTDVGYGSCQIPCQTKVWMPQYVKETVPYSKFHA